MRHECMRGSELKTHIVHARTIHTSPYKPQAAAASQRSVSKLVCTEVYGAQRSMRQRLCAHQALDPAQAGSSLFKSWTSADLSMNAARRLRECMNLCKLQHHIGKALLLAKCWSKDQKIAFGVAWHLRRVAFCTHREEIGKSHTSPTRPAGLESRFHRLSSRS